MSASGIAFTILGFLLLAAALVAGVVPLTEYGLTVFARDLLEANMHDPTYSDYTIAVVLPRYNAQVILMVGLCVLAAGAFVIALVTRRTQRRGHPATWTQKQ